jgi:Fe-S-cluster containining protein
MNELPPCTSCGACCVPKHVGEDCGGQISLPPGQTAYPRAVYLSKTDLRRLPDKYKGSVERYALGTKLGADGVLRCVALEGELLTPTVRCDCYADRPSVCSAVERGSKRCRAAFAAASRSAAPLMAEP